MSPSREFYFGPTPEEQALISAWHGAKIPCPEDIQPETWRDQFVCKVTRGEKTVLAIARPNDSPELGMGFLTIHTEGRYPFSDYNRSVLGTSDPKGWMELGTNLHVRSNYSHVSCGGTGDRIKYLEVIRQDPTDKFWQKREGWRYVRNMERVTTPEQRAAGLAKGIEADLGDVFSIEPITFDEAMALAIS